MLNKSIDEMGMSARARNMLWKEGIRTVGDLAAALDNGRPGLRGIEIAKIPGMGAVSMRNILEAAENFGLNVRRCYLYKKRPSKARTDEGRAALEKADALRAEARALLKQARELERGAQ